jgi:CheY-like chemotaxis protein
VVSASGEPRLILVVDDNELVALSLEDVLRDAGFAVLTVNSGHDAVEIMEHSPELAAVVTDIRLEPGTDGWEVAERAREMHPDVAIVYITGSIALDHAGCAVPNSRLLRKPFGGPQVIDAVSNLIDGPSQTLH